MANLKPTFTNLKLKTNTATTTINYGDVEIEVLQYLPIEQKFDLINLAVLKSLISGYVDPTLLEMNFMLGVIYKYSNISFTEKQMQNEFNLYNAFESTGLADVIYQAIPERERDELCDKLEETIKQKTSYDQSIAGSLESFANSISDKMKETVELLNDLSPEKFEEAKRFVEFARESNNNLPFPKQEEN